MDHIQGNMKREKNEIKTRQIKIGARKWRVKKEKENIRPNFICRENDNLETMTMQNSITNRQKI